MVRTLLVRGMLVGIVAGLLSFGFLKVYGEPQVDRAIAFEAQLDEAKAAAEKAKGMHMSDEEEPELVSRPVQAGIGLFTAVIVYSAAFGGLFGLAFAFAYGRVPGALTPQGCISIARGDGLHRDLSRAEPEISGKSALGRRPRDNRHPHRALFHHDRDLARSHGRGGNVQALVCSAIGGVERQPRRGRMLYRRGRYRRASASRGQRSSGRVSRRRAVEIPHRVAGCAIHHVGDAWPAFRRLDPAGAIGARGRLPRMTPAIRGAR